MARKLPVVGFDKDSFQRRYVASTQRAGRSADATEDVFRSELADYDPYEAVRTAARGAFDEFKPELERSIEDLRGQEVGMGRLDTGFAQEDEDRLVRDSLKNLNSEIARNSVAAAGLDLQSINALGAFSQAQRDQYLDLVAGGLDRITAEENMKRQKKGGLFGALGSVIGGVGGFLVGGPAGAYAGSKIGGSVGRGIGG